MDKTLHIVSFDIPYPPNYGGIIDVYYKIKHLHSAGIKIHLHLFEYSRKKSEELEKYCKSVTYYKRKSSPFLVFSATPYIVKSRANKKLLENLQNDNYPVLFEGLHTSIYSKYLSKKTYVRTHNIEHLYYKGLAYSEKNIIKKIFFITESWKLKLYEKILHKTTGIFTISHSEQDYFANKYGKKSSYIPVFHDSEFKNHLSKKGKYLLWHGDLRTSDNINAVLFLINIFKNTEYNLKIASGSINSRIQNKINQYPNIQFVRVTNNKDFDNLFENSHINLLYTFQKTGIKLKLINALYKGKHIIGNLKILGDTGLENLCYLANTKDEFLYHVKNLMNQDFISENIEKRKKNMIKFSPSESAKKIIKIIFKH